MKRTVLFVCLFVLRSVSQSNFTLPSQQYVDSNQLYTLPGIDDVIGYGYDARYSDPDDAMKKPIMAYTYASAKTYFFPSDATRIWKVPDQIDVRTINRQDADTKLFETIDAYRQNLLVQVGISAFSSSALQTCAVQYNGNSTCAPGLISNSSKMFGIGADLQYVQSKTSDNSKWISTNTESIVLYYAALRQDLFILPNVKNDMQALELGALGSNASVYWNFFNLYGTHFVSSAMMGGKIQLLSLIDKSYTTSSYNLSANASATYQVSQAEAVQTSRSMFQSTLNAQVGFGLENVATNTTFYTSNDWDIWGGDVTRVNLLNPDIAASQMNVWKSTLSSNPIAASFNLEPIENLFDDPFIRSQIEAARAIYLTFDTDTIVSLINNDIKLKRRTPESYVSQFATN